MEVFAATVDGSYSLLTVVMGTSVWGVVGLHSFLGGRMVLFFFIIIIIFFLFNICIFFSVYVYFNNGGLNN